MLFDSMFMNASSRQLSTELCVSFWQHTDTLDLLSASSCDEVHYNMYKKASKLSVCIHIATKLTTIYSNLIRMALGQ